MSECQRIDRSGSYIPLVVACSRIFHGRNRTIRNALQVIGAESTRKFIHFVDGLLSQSADVPYKCIHPGHGLNACLPAGVDDAADAGENGIYAL